MKEEKCVLVINRPYSCVCCMCRGGDDCFAIEDIEMKDKFHDWYRHINRQPAPMTITWENCPLRFLPKKLDKNDLIKTDIGLLETTIDFREGWNKCLEAITGETE